MSDQPNCPIAWSQLVPPPPHIVECHLAISRSGDCPLEDHQLHVFRFTGQDAEDWHLAIHLPMLASPGQLVEYRRQYRGPMAEAKSSIEEDYRRVAGI